MQVPEAPRGQKWALIAAGEYHSVGVTEHGNMCTWGLNNYGQVRHARLILGRARRILSYPGRYPVLPCSALCLILELIQSHPGHYPV